MRKLLLASGLLLVLGSLFLVVLFILIMLNIHQPTESIGFWITVGVLFFGMILTGTGFNILFMFLRKLTERNTQEDKLYIYNDVLNGNNN